MSNGNTALTLALGAGAGLGVWALIRAAYIAGKESCQPLVTEDASGSTPSSGIATTTKAEATVPRPCALRLDAKGLTADGVPIDIPAAVSTCQAAGRADLVLADDAPSGVYADLAAAFQTAGILISQRRNARARRRVRGRRLQVTDRPKPRARDDRHATYERFTLRTYPEGSRGGAQLRHFHADPATSWKDAYYRLIAAGIVNARRAGRTHEAGGWMLSVDPAHYRADRAEALP